MVENHHTPPLPTVVPDQTIGYGSQIWLLVDLLKELKLAVEVLSLQLVGETLLN